MVGSGGGVSVGAAVGVGVSVAVGVGVSVGVAFFVGSAVALTETDSADASLPLLGIFGSSYSEILYYKYV